MSTSGLFRLDDQIAVVTGGAGLLGEQHAIALSDMGARVVLADLDEAACRDRAKQISQSTDSTGTEVIGLRGDVTSSDSWQSLVEEIVSRLGRIDILVNNAAFTNQSQSPNYAASFTDFPLADWNGILDVNLTGTFLGCQNVGRQMLAQGSGSIINLASLYGVVSPNHRMYPGTGIHQPVAYSVSKTAVVGLTRYLATLWGESGIRVNCITPGGIANEHPEPFTERYAQLSPMGRMASSDEMRGALIYLASRASNYCTGHNLVVDGGWTAW